MNPQVLHSWAQLIVLKDILKTLVSVLIACFFSSLFPNKICSPLYVISYSWYRHDEINGRIYIYIINTVPYPIGGEGVSVACVHIKTTTPILKGVRDIFFWSHYEWPGVRNVSLSHYKYHVSMRNQFHAVFVVL